eukprot:Skav221574  [mRNA]  locus=scaffold1376:896869:897594:- [translate_table: standard]
MAPAAETMSAKLMRYHLTDPWILPTPRLDHWRDNAWGPSWGSIFCRWIAQIHWPSAEACHEHQSLGITWIELAVSLMLFAGLYLPLRRCGADGHDRLVMCANFAELTGYQAKFSEFSDMVQLMFGQFATLRSEPLHPPMARRLVKSAYVQGFTLHSSGLSERPMLPNQVQMLTHMERYLKLHRGPAWSVPPDLSLPSPPETVQQMRAEIRGKWQDRCKQSQTSAVKLRQQMKTPSQSLVFH